MSAGRLVLLKEGECLNAYFTPGTTMADALFLGAIRLSIITNHPRLRTVFMTMMRQGVADMKRPTQFDDDEGDHDE
jgi:hypothetical protein